MELGAFSVSLSVRDLEVSKAFYERLGFKQTGGDGEHYLMMVNGTTVVGLFKGLFDGNILTFNPGLVQTGEKVTDFTDVRDIRNALVDSGIEMLTDTDPGGTEPTHIAFKDPDGNAILIDQFFPKPGSSTE